jgi:hypothetical protein
VNAEIAARIPASPPFNHYPNGNDLQRTLDHDSANTNSVKFVLTDIHPHIPEWTEAAKLSKNLSFISEPVDAANAPAHLMRNDGKKLFRLYNLSFHHFDDNLASSILRNTLETADGFGYVTATSI